MKPLVCALIRFVIVFVLLGGLAAPWETRAASPPIDVGIGVRDITPQLPIWLAGYAARKHPADRVGQPLVTQALAFRNPSGERFVFVALDNCEVSHAFTVPVIQGAGTRFGLKPGEVMIVSSHTHSAPVLDMTLEGMYPLQAADREQVKAYTQLLQSRILDAIGSALEDFKPARLEQGLGRTTFAMNRRVYKGDDMVFGENLDGPVIWDVPVLRIRGTNDAVRAVVFGYSCHGTSIQGEDFYIVSGDYMAYARQHLETLLPGAVAIYLTGMGADSNPSPRGSLLDAQRHGLELAGAVMSVLNRPMRPVRGLLRLAYEEVDLPLVDPPGREQLAKDSQSNDTYVRHRAGVYLDLLNQSRSLPKVRLPVAAVRLGDDLTFVTMGGEVVVDYGLRFQRLFAQDHPWLVGYAYEVPCYIPSARILKEGGYEAQSSLVYYGVYGPFRGQIEELLVQKMTALVERVR